jgi:limonene-1,2-epoxide hydrolase
MPAPQKGVLIANVDQQKNQTDGNKMKREIEMSEIPIGIAASEGVVLAVLTHLKNGEIDDAIARFAEEFRFKDHGIGLQFKHKERLAEFFQNRVSLQRRIWVKLPRLVSGDHVITEWTHQMTLTEPFYGGLSRRVPVSLHGASIVRIENGRITDWSDYYDGLASRRTALASHFTEWVGL